MMYDVVAVDDEPMMRRLVSEILRRMEWKAAVFASGNEVLDALRAEGTHVLVTDIDMPGMDGVVLAHRVHAQCPDLPIVALAGSVHAADLDPTDFTCVLSKPVPLHDFVETIAHYIAA